MKLTQLNIIIGNDVRLDCGIKLWTCNTRIADFGIREGVAMAHNSYTMSTLGLPDYVQTTRVHGIIITCICMYSIGLALLTILLMCLKIIWQHSQQYASMYSTK